MGHSISTPPTEGHKPTRKSYSSKSSNSTHHALKRIGGTTIISAAIRQSELHSPTSDSRHKRAWKACERCRMKKTKCDGEFPCKRCKDDGLICTASAQKKVEYKQLPQGYAEVLEMTQLSLIATVRKLYSMVQNGEKWEGEEPGVNDCGQPIVHNIATMLGCIRPSSDIDLSVHHVFPENKRDLNDLVKQLEAQKPDLYSQQPTTATITGNASPTSNATDLGSASEQEQDHNPTPATRHPLPYSDFDGEQPGPAMFHDQATLAALTAQWGNAPPMSMMPDFPSHPLTVTNDMPTQGLLESEFGQLRPYNVSCPYPEVMMGMGDPMIYSGFGDDEGQQLCL